MSSDADGRGAPSHRRARATFIVLATTALALLALAPLSQAKYVVDGFGTGNVEGQWFGGQFAESRGVAVNSAGAGGVEPGTAYVVDSQNRLQRFAPDGSFQRTWGFNVKGNDERQTVTTVDHGNEGAGSNINGTFTLSFGGYTTASISPYAFGETVRSRLEALPSIGAGNVSVSGPVIASDEVGESGQIWTIRFVGALSGTNVEQVTADGSGLFASCCGDPQPGIFTETLENGSGGSFAGFEICTVANECQNGIAVPATANGGQLNQPQGVAVDQGTGNVYVTEQGNSRVSEFDADGNFIRTFGWDVVKTGGSGDVSTNAFEVCTVAGDCKQGVSGANGGEFGSEIGYPTVDSAGNVWVADAANRRVQKFDSSGNFIAAYGYDVDVAGGGGAMESCTSTAAGACRAGASGSALGKFSSNSPRQIAFDSLGNLYALDSGNARVQKFDPTLLASVTDFAPGVFDLYTTQAPEAMVASQGGNTITFSVWNNLAATEAEREKQTIEIDPSDESVTEQSLVGIHLNSSFAGLAFDSASGNLYASKTGTPRVLVLGDTRPPNVVPAVTPVTAKTDTSATLTGTVDPKGGLGATGCKFEISTDQAEWSQAGAGQGTGTAGGGKIIENVVVTTGAFVPGQLITVDGEKTGTIVEVQGSTIKLSEGVFKAKHTAVLRAVPPEPCESLDPDGGPQPISFDVGSLVPNTHYYFRLSAERRLVAGSSVTTPVGQFDTESVAPAVSGDDLTDVTDVTDVSARLIGTVNPKNSDTGYVFEYGTTPVLGSSSAPVAIGGGNVPLVFSQVVSGLTPDTTYYFRVAATNAFGTSHSPERTFHTRATPLPNPEHRAYEQVSPADKNFVGAYTQTFSGVLGTRSFVAPTGDAIGFVSTASYGEPPALNPLLEALYRSHRGASGWQTQAARPLSCNATNNAVFSPNLDYAVVAQFEGIQTDASCAPATLVEGAPLGQGNLYREDFEGGYQLLAPEPATGFFPDPPTYPGTSFSAASEDFSRIAYTSTGQQTPDSLGTGIVQAFEWHEGQISLISRDTGSGGGAPFATDSSVPPSVPGSFSSTGSVDRNHAVSATGDRLYLQNPTEGTFNNDCVAANCELYLREGGETRWASEQECEPACPNANGADRFRAANPAGDRALFISGAKLTDDASSYICNPGVGAGSLTGCNLYMYTDSPDPASERNLTLLSRDDEPADGGKAGVIAVVGISEDGDTVYFVDRGQIVSGGPTAAGPKLYRWHRGEGVAYLMTFPEGSAAAGAEESNWTAPGHMTPSGEYVWVKTQVRLRPAIDRDSSTDVYRWSKPEGWACISCQTPGSPSLPDAHVSHGFGAETQAAISDDGQRVFFLTPDALVPQDANSPCAISTQPTRGGGGINGYPCSDVYEWHEGALSLITPGDYVDPDSLTVPHLLGASGSGRDVFFSTTQHLVGWDTDEIVDIYDARAGGGFPEPPPKGAPCEGEACHGGSPAAPGAAGAGTAVFQGPGNPAATHHKKKRKHHQKHRRHGKHPHRRAANHNRRAAR